jgi:hypothetical protein
MNGVVILLGLNRLGKHVYGGTVPEATVRRRRVRNRAAAKQRQVNRKKDVNAH